MLTLIPSAIVVSNLSYDGTFSKILGDIFRFDFGRVVSYIASAIFAVPVTMYLFGALSGDSEKRSNEERAAALTQAKERAASRRRLPVISAVTAGIPLLFFYLVFFISQKDSYLSAFTGVLPDGFIYADYAREGFFELCRVAALNAFLIFLCWVFTRRTKKAPSAAIRVLSSLLSLCSLILITTAVAKMAMYIDAYGLTRLRVYVTLAMILMAIGFLFTLAKQIFPKLRMTWICVILASLLLFVPAFGNMDARIAEYNVSRYMDGTLSSVDYEMLKDIREAALPSLVSLYESDKATDRDRSQIVSLAKDQHRKYQKQTSIFTYSIPKLQAEAAIKKIQESDKE